MCHWREPDSAFSPRLGGGEGGWPSLSLKIHSFLHSPTLSSPSLLSLPPSHRPSLRAWLLWRHGEHACESVCVCVCVCRHAHHTLIFSWCTWRGVTGMSREVTFSFSFFSLKKKRKKSYCPFPPSHPLFFDEDSEENGDELSISLCKHQR